MPRIKAASFLALLLSSQLLHSQSRPTGADMDRLLSDTARHYREAKSLLIKRTQVNRNESERSHVSDRFDSVVAVLGNGSYRREDKSWFDWSVTIRNGSRQWEVRPWRHQYAEFSVAPTAVKVNQLGNIEGWPEFLTQINTKLKNGKPERFETITVNGKSHHCLELIGPAPKEEPPLDPSVVTNKTVYWIDREQKLLVKEEYVFQTRNSRPAATLMRFGTSAPLWAVDCALIAFFSSQYPAQITHKS